MCRPVAFADKIIDPFVPVCPGGATRLDVCFMVGQITTDQVLSEVSMTSTGTAFVGIVNLSNHCFFHWLSSPLLFWLHTNCQRCWVIGSVVAVSHSQEGSPTQVCASYAVEAMCTTMNLNSVHYAQT
jgi:hypothetical protein